MERSTAEQANEVDGMQPARGRWADVERTFPQPRDEGNRQRQFSWPLYDEIGRHVEGERWDPNITRSFRRNMLSISNMLSSLARRKGNLDDGASWQAVQPIIKTEVARILENMTVNMFPLRACQGQWGARLLMVEAFRRMSRSNTSGRFNRSAIRITIVAYINAIAVN